MIKHANIAFFIPHIGCHFRCSFCDQTSISGAKDAPSPQDIKAKLKEIVENMQDDDLKKTEIAFFGGSFTAIDKTLMVSYLKAAGEFLGKNGFLGIRISTRPDCIDDDMLKTLKNYGVTSIELGAQSMDDDVLTANLRGHTSYDVKNACNLIRKHNFELGLQMMIGLYRSDVKSEYKSAELICACRPKTVRIYPTLVIKGSFLEKLYNQGKYTPLNVAQAVEITKDLIALFEREGIKVIRAGLHSQSGLKETVAAGPYHPAFGELCQNALFYDRIKLLLDEKQKGRYNIYVHPLNLSKAIGQKRANIERFSKLGYALNIKAKGELKEDQINVKRLE